MSKSVALRDGGALVGIGRVHQLTTCQVDLFWDDGIENAIECMPAEGELSLSGDGARVRVGKGVKLLDVVVLSSDMRRVPKHAVERLCVVLYSADRVVRSGEGHTLYRVEELAIWSGGHGAIKVVPGVCTQEVTDIFRGELTTLEWE